MKPNPGAQTNLWGHNMKTKRFLSLAVILLFLSTAFFYGFTLPSTTGTGDYQIRSSAQSDMVLYEITVTSDASGDASITVPSLFGNLQKVAFDPQSASPTTGYDITIAGVDAVDVLLSNGISLDDEDTSSALIMDATYPMGYPVAGDHTLTGADMGATKETLVYLWVRR